MQRSEKIDYARALSEKLRRETEEKLLYYYPDEGPLRRELYVKHTAYFEAGTRYRQRLMMAANRVGKCVTGDTMIESPFGEARRIDSITGKHWVWAWDGTKKVPALAAPPITKPAERVYRVWLESGQYVDCAAEHRFLSAVGWIFLSDLFEFVPSLPESTSGIGPLKSLEDALYYLRKLPNSQDDYLKGRRLDDARPQMDREVGRAFSPSQDDVPKRSPAWWSLGGVVDKCKRTLLRLFSRLSSQGDARRISGQFAESSVLTDDIDAKSYRDSRPFELLSLDELEDHSRLASLEDSRLIEGVSKFVTPDGKLESVICYQPLDIQTIYDFHVPTYRNYCTQGFVHHNTEGVGGYEMTLHLTGRYPPWWNGRRFDRPIVAWAAGDTGKTVREIVQKKLLGPFHSMGTGLIPKKDIIKTTPKAGVPEAVDTVQVQHYDEFGNPDGISTLNLKSYDQKRISFQGTEIDVFWLVEEPPLGIYSECLLRTMTNKGIVMCTFTPLEGLSETVMHFLEGGLIEEKDDGSKFVLMATWDHAPHLSAAEKEELWKEIPPYQRDARSKGIPQLGSGAIYPFPESDLSIQDFPVPDHWPRFFGMDVGWKRTAVGWYAWDRENDIVYRIGEHYRGEAEPVVHAQAIKSRGDWIPGVLDPAARGRSQIDGLQLYQMYVDLGLNLDFATNGVESGIYEVWQRMSSGRFKVFKSCQNWFFEFRLYRRDEKGRIVKKDDHAMDEMRYAIVSGIKRAIVKPVEQPESESRGDSGGSWMG